MQSRSRNKDPWSPQLMKIAVEIRETDRLLWRYENRPRQMSVSRGAWCQKRFGWQELGTPESPRDSNEWKVWHGRLKERRERLRSKAQSKQREEWRRQREKNRKWIANRVEEGKWKDIFWRVRGKRRACIDREVLVVWREEGGVRKRVVLSTGKEIGEELSSFFAEWMGAGVDRWYQKHCELPGGERVVTEIHPLFEDSETGWDMRKRLAVSYTHLTLPTINSV